MPHTPWMRGRLIFVCIGLILFAFVAGIYTPSANQIRSWIKNWSENHGHHAINDEPRLRAALMQLPRRLHKALADSENALPKIYIDIKFKHIQKIYHKRAQALQDGILVQQDDDLVPATIRYNNRAIKTKLRLKGDWTDHLEGKKWSFRLHVRGKDQLFGMRRFSIQHPRVRGYQSEPIFMETLRHVGVLAPRYFFIEVVINGENLGTMALEEHFSKELLEANGRREGVIVRYDESLLWDARVLEISENNEAIFNSYRNASIDSFRSSRVNKSPALRENLSVAVGLLRSFTRGDLSAPQVFNVKLMGRFLAVLEFWGARHAMIWHNLRFYLNPVTLKLEPIGFDSDLHNREQPGTVIAQQEPIAAAMLADAEIFDSYHQTLKQLSQEVLDGSLIGKLQAVEDRHLHALRKEFYFLERFPLEELNRRANYFASLDGEKLKEKPVPFPSYPEIVHAFLIDDDGNTYLDLSSMVPHDVEITNLQWRGNKDDSAVREFEPERKIDFPLTLAATPAGEIPIAQRIACASVEDHNQFSLEVTASIKGDIKSYRQVATDYFAPLKRHPIPNAEIERQLAKHPFLRLGDDGNTVHVHQGTWQVSDSIVIPPDYRLNVGAGTTLTFLEGDGLFAAGAITCKGTANRPIVFRGTPAANGQSPGAWQGIFVQGGKHPSIWSYVTVRDTRGIHRPGWTLTGGVTFYESTVHLDHCAFEYNQAEDALNLIHSKFRIVDTDFFSTVSDAYDSDFSVGEVHNGVFRDIGRAGGGDAIDISGSRVSVSGTRFINVSDKALSVGERSSMTAKDVVVEHSGTGAASKDGSFLELSNALITDVTVAGLMTYVKKPEYGPARIIATGIEYSGGAPFARAEKGSEIVVDGNEIEPENMDVQALYDTVMKKGARQ